MNECPLFVEYRRELVMIIGVAYSERSRLLVVCIISSFYQQVEVMEVEINEEQATKEVL